MINIYHTGHEQSMHRVTAWPGQERQADNGKKSQRNYLGQVLRDAGLPSDDEEEFVKKGIKDFEGNA
jgi:hypothetical protein